MDFKDIKTPEELMKWLDENFEYGVIDNKGKKIQNGEEFQKACNKYWKVRPVLEIIRSKVGHCYDQTELERYWFTKNGYKIKTFWVATYHKNSYTMCHAYLAYLNNNKWYYFEHSDGYNRGSYEFDKLQDLIEFQAKLMIKSSKAEQPNLKLSVCTNCFKKPKCHISMKEYREFVTSSKEVLDKSEEELNNGLSC